MANYAWTTMVCISVAALAGACSGGGSSAAEAAIDEMEPATVSSAEDAQVWAEASAPNAFGTAYLPISVADANRQLGEDDCPTFIEDGSTTTYEGGCTDNEGNRWFGRATTSGSMLSGELNISYEGFGSEATEECGGEMVTTDAVWDGEVKVSAGAQSVNMDIDLIAETTGPGESCAPEEGTMALAYSLTMAQGDDTDGDGEPDEEVWNGSGRIGNSIDGFVEARTEDEILDDSVCDTEALSGTTTVNAGDDVLVFTYDGAGDCDPESTVTWSLNGEDQGELTGVSCAAAGGRGTLAGWIALALSLGAIITRRRQRYSP